MRAQARRLLFSAFAHATAAAVVIGLVVGFGFIGYLGLLAWAILAGSGIGGPLALIGMMLVALVASLLAATCVLFPVTLGADFLCGQLLRWPRVAQIPVATVLCFLEVVGSCVSIGWLRHSDVAAAFKFGILSWILLLVPLGVYWWVLQFHAGVRWATARLWARIRRAPSHDSPQRMDGRGAF